MTGSVAWTDHEMALWQTIDIVGRISSGAPLVTYASTFALQFGGRNEGLLATAPYDRQWLGAVGDGSYGSSTFVAGGFSPLGVALGAATLGASAMGNARRRNRAAADASVVWRQLDRGQVSVSTHGFYLTPGAGILGFSHHDILQMELLGPGQVQWTSNMAAGGTDTFITTSFLGELMFVLWAIRRCPGHPQLVGLTWLPQPFVERARFAGRQQDIDAGVAGLRSGRPLPPLPA